MITVAQASAWYPPVSWGGTEVYVTGLVRELYGQDVNSTIIAPLGAHHPNDYSFDGTLVRTFPIDPTLSRAGRQGDDSDEGLTRFREILKELRPDVYHQHSWSYGLGTPHLRVAKALGIPTVLTAHVPGVTCLRGTMMRFGTDVCDGRIDRFTCAACWGQVRGAPKFAALGFAAMSLKVGSFADRMLPASRVTSALSGSALVAQVRDNLDTMIGNADRIVAVCQWLYEALLLNGVPREKLVLNRQGVDCEFAAQVLSEHSVRWPGYHEQKKFRLLYLGRWQAVKGIDVLVRAVRALPLELPVELVIHGTGDGPEERAYAARITQLAGDDKRIVIAPPVPRAELAKTFLQADALAVPSRWLETGPLVVLEAKAAGLPVLGSRLGGIAESVREPDDGLLVEPDDVEAWSGAILRMCQSRTGDRKPTKTRTMRDVAIDMNEIYRGLRAAPVRKDEEYTCVSP